QNTHGVRENSIKKLRRIALLLVLGLPAIPRAVYSTSAGTFVVSFQEAPVADAKDLAPEPHAGEWYTWVLSSGGQFRLPAPPAPGSAPEKQELAELKAQLVQRTPQTLDRVRYWATGPASCRWTEVQLDCILKYKKTPPRSSRGLALLHTAIHDAVVAAWSQKYAYRRRRPSEADPSIKEAVAPSPDPCYPSEHAVVA